MQKDTQTEAGLASHLTLELEAFEPQSVYDAAMEMRYTKTGVTDTSKIEMVFGLNVYYALMSHSEHKSIGAGEDNHQTFEGARIVVDCKNLNRLAMRVSI